MKNLLIVLLLFIPCVSDFNNFTLVDSYSFRNTCLNINDINDAYGGGITILGDSVYIGLGNGLYELNKTGNFVNSLYIKKGVIKGLKNDGKNVFILASDNNKYVKAYKLEDNKTIKSWFNGDGWNDTNNLTWGIGQVDNNILVSKGLPYSVRVHSQINESIKEYNLGIQPSGGLAVFTNKEDYTYFFVATRDSLRLFNFFNGQENISSYPYTIHNNGVPKIGYTNYIQALGSDPKNGLLYVLETDVFMGYPCGPFGSGIITRTPALYVYSLGTNFDSNSSFNYNLSSEKNVSVPLKEDILKKFIDVFVSNFSKPILINLEGKDMLIESGFGKLGKLLKYEGETAKLPYSAVIANLNDTIYIYSNSDYGTLNALHYLLEKTISTNWIYMIKDINEKALMSYDYLISNELTNETILRTFSDLYEREDYGFKNLRLIRYKPLISDKLDKYNGNPVILARGLWSDITTWDKFGRELASKGKDVFLIELTGGPSMDCDDCPDYTYEELVSTILPNYVSKVKEISNSTLIDYVGFSNGARVALDSSVSFDNLIVIGAPGAFEGFSPASESIRLRGGDAIESFEKDNVTHFPFLTLMARVSGLKKITEDTSKISLNLFKKYSFFISSSEDEQPGKGTKSNDFAIVQGNQFITSDAIVTVDDEKSIYDNLNSNNKKYFNVFGNHINLADRLETKYLVTKLLEKYPLNKLDKLIYLKEEFTNK